ncbi:MAG: WhiB family transcriptional regulator [Actinomycetota bacterium]|nr:WhiB family transcriptional regulator [Actinomycetota bacterium]
MVLPQEWKLQSSCSKVADLPRIAERGDVTEPARIAMAAVCETCPVLLDCRLYAARHAITAGFWAGRFRSDADDIVGDAA